MWELVKCEARTIYTARAATPSYHGEAATRVVGQANCGRPRLHTLLVSHCTLHQWQKISTRLKTAFSLHSTPMSYLEMVWSGYGITPPQSSIQRIWIGSKVPVKVLRDATMLESEGINSSGDVTRGLADGQKTKIDAVAGNSCSKI